MDFEIGDTSICIHEFESYGDVGYRLATIVGHTQGDSVLFEIDATRSARRTDFGDGHVVVNGRIDAHIDGRVVAGAVTCAEATEVVEGVVEVLGCIAPVSRTPVVVVTVVEEVTRGGITMPTDCTIGVLRSPKIAIGAIVHHCVVRDGHLGCVVGGNADVVSGVGEGFDIILMVYKTSQSNCDVSNVARGIEVGLVRRSIDKFEYRTHREQGTHRHQVTIVATREVGEALGAGLVAIIVVAKGNLMGGRDVLLTDIANSVTQGYLEHAAVERVNGAVHCNGDQLQVVGGIDKECRRVDIVFRVIVNNAVRQRAGNYHVLRIDNTQRRRHLNTVFVKGANRQSGNRIGNRLRQGRDVAQIGMPCDIVLRCITVIVQQHPNRNRVGFDIQHLGVAACCNRRHDGFQDGRNCDVVSQAGELMGANRRSRNLRTDIAEDIVGHIGVVLCLVGKLGKGKSQISDTSEIRVLLKRVRVFVINPLQAVEADAI